MEYFKIWDEIVKQHILSQMDVYLKNYKIKEEVGLIFAMMDHLFSYSMYKYLCNINDDKDNKNVNVGIEDDDDKKEGMGNVKEIDIKTEQKLLKSEQFVKTKGNALFLDIENKTRYKCIENTYISWLFEYWRKYYYRAKNLLNVYAVHI